jgi:hypothetical protein
MTTVVVIFNPETNHRKIRISNLGSTGEIVLDPGCTHTAHVWDDNTIHISEDAPRSPPTEGTAPL